MAMNAASGNHDVYLYGMTVLSTIHLLDGPYPEADSYREIKESFILPGGETANAAIVLSTLGLKTRIDGPFLGVRTKEGITGLCRKYNIDCSGMYYDASYDGVQDLVLIGGNSRTIFGKFAGYFSSRKRWTQPDAEAIGCAKIISIDPFFGDESKKAALYCAEARKKYVTIDCPPDSDIHINSAANVISNEYIKNEFPEENISLIFEKYAGHSDGLVIFTFGAREILYGRKGQKIKSLTPYKIDVKSTLGAGDTFRAGVVYGILNGWKDEDTVRFAAATAASVCSRFPMALDPPGLDEIMRLVVGK